MDDNRLDPWMLRADWRGDGRSWLWIDGDHWPGGVAIDPLPPVPVIGMGAPVAGVDLAIEPGFSLEGLAASIERTPLAAATLVHLLRAIERSRPGDALVAESMAYAMLQQGAEHRRWRETRSPVGGAPGELGIEREGGLLRVTIDRPAARNAIDRAMRDALFDAFELAAADLSIAAIELRATGRTFSVGAELGEFGTTSDPAVAHSIRMRTMPAWPLLRRSGLLFAHVQGGCIGAGLELAAFAARLTAAPDAWFQLPEVAMGILPGFGGTVSIPHRIGRRRAALLMLSGRRINARTALAWGLVDAIVDEAAGDDGRADALAR